MLEKHLRSGGTEASDKCLAPLSQVRGQVLSEKYPASLFGRLGTVMSLSSGIAMPRCLCKQGLDPEIPKDSHRLSTQTIRIGGQILAAA